MKEHPILFSTEMVKAILEGRKTQTRRIIKPQPIDNTEIDGNFFEGNHKGYVKVDGHPNWQEQFAYEFGRYSKGDILWVRETYAIENQNSIYKADEGITVPFFNFDQKWKPSIFMPRTACRLLLEITNIRVERLQDISPDDACDEGIEYWNIDADALEGGELQADFKNYTWKDDENSEDYFFPSFASCIESYRTLWQSINGKESWIANPWVWVIEFKVK